MIDWHDVKDIIPGSNRSVLLHAESIGNGIRCRHLTYGPYKPDSTGKMLVDMTNPEGNIIKCEVTHWSEINRPE